MSEHRATIAWSRSDSDFSYEKYPRDLRRTTLTTGAPAIPFARAA